MGIVNRSQADINKNMDMIAARQREREFFATSPDYSHLASKMGSEYLARLLSKVSIYPSIMQIQTYRDGMGMFCALSDFLLQFSRVAWLLI